MFGLVYKNFSNNKKIEIKEEPKEEPKNNKIPRPIWKFEHNPLEERCPELFSGKDTQSYLNEEINSRK